LQLPLLVQLQIGAGKLDKKRNGETTPQKTEKDVQGRTV
jgi:hypothetical protein